MRADAVHVSLCQVGMFFCENCVSLTGVDAGYHEDQLIGRFFYEQLYHVSSRPVANESDAIEVKFGLSLQQIKDVVGIDGENTWCDTVVLLYIMMARDSYGAIGLYDKLCNVKQLKWPYLKKTARFTMLG